MLRIFRHFFRVPTLVLGISESVLLTLVLYLIARPAMRDTPKISGWRMSNSHSDWRVLAIVAMMAVGLYNSDVFLDYRIASLRALLALALIVPMAFGVTYVFQTQLGGREQIDSFIGL